MLLAIIEEFPNALGYRFLLCQCDLGVQKSSRNVLSCMGRGCREFGEFLLEESVRFFDASRLEAGEEFWNADGNHVHERQIQVG